ncbi:putative transposase [Variovorax paradoxus]|jgi:putative transposase|uniref:transposase n=1 Tax=Variovorax paradoxus TaxID=34073 RepID=UPI002793725B|nr:transposase [Variovorax paradoxus]MDQ0572011.1 putative transposase [Variovorax paradoxus]
MARLPRLTLADMPHHVIQRGNNRQAIFVDRADHERLLGLLADAAPRFGIALHAYVLMDNHFHLLATPGTTTGLPQFMQSVGRSYVRYFNDRHGRSGTLWEGRYRSTLIQTDRYLLTCMAYIDLNPVRAGLVSDARDFPWSSYAHYAGLRQDKLLTPHPLYWELGNTPFAREAAYAELVRAGVRAADQGTLTEATLRGWAAGDANFLASLQKSTERRVAKAKAGRPPSAPGS